MAIIRQQILIEAPVAKVYEAISTVDGISSWWGKQTAIQTDRGLVLEHNPGPQHGVVKLRVTELVRNKRVEWECISTHPKSSPASAWTGTHFIFDMTERNSVASSGSDLSQRGATALDFSQTGYDERSEFFETNKSAWEQVLQSLKQVLESRRG